MGIAFIILAFCVVLYVVIGTIFVRRLRRKIDNKVASIEFQKNLLIGVYSRESDAARRLRMIILIAPFIFIVLGTIISVFWLGYL